MAFVMLPIIHSARSFKYGIFNASPVSAFDAPDSVENFSLSSDKWHLVQKSFFPSHWRSRMGLDKALAQEAYRLLVAPSKNRIQWVGRLPDYHCDENPYESTNKMTPV